MDTNELSEKIGRFLQEKEDYINSILNYGGVPPVRHVDLGNDSNNPDGHPEPVYTYVTEPYIAANDEDKALFKEAMEFAEDRSPDLYSLMGKCYELTTKAYEYYESPEFLSYCRKLRNEAINYDAIVDAESNIALRLDDAHNINELDFFNFLKEVKMIIDGETIPFTPEEVADIMSGFPADFSYSRQVSVRNALFAGVSPDEIKSLFGKLGRNEDGSRELLSRKMFPADVLIRKRLIGTLPFEEYGTEQIKAITEIISGRMQTVVSNEANGVHRDIKLKDDVFRFINNPHRFSANQMRDLAEWFNSHDDFSDLEILDSLSLSVDDVQRLLSLIDYAIKNGVDTTQLQKVEEVFSLIDRNGYGNYENIQSFYNCLPLNDNQFDTLIELLKKFNRSEQQKYILKAFEYKFTDEQYSYLWEMTNKVEPSTNLEGERYYHLPYKFEKAVRIFKTGCSSVDMAEVLYNAVTLDESIYLCKKYLDGTLSEDMVKAFVSGISQNYTVGPLQTRWGEVYTGIDDPRQKLPVIDLYIDIVNKGCYNYQSDEFFGFTPQQAESFLKIMESAPYRFDCEDRLVEAIYDRYMPYSHVTPKDFRLVSVDKWMKFAEACASIEPDKCKDIVGYDDYGDEVLSDEISVYEWVSQINDKLYPEPDSASLDSNKSKSSDRDFN